MSTTPIRTSKQAHQLDFIGDHLAIDFVNTARMVGGELTDTIQTDDDVKVWLRLAAVPVSPKPAAWPRRGARRGGSPPAWGRTARRSRQRRPENARRSKFSMRFSRSSASHSILVERSASKLEFTRVYHGMTPEGVSGARCGVGRGSSG